MTRPPPPPPPPPPHTHTHTHKTPPSIMAKTTHTQLGQSISITVNSFLFAFSAEVKRTLRKTERKRIKSKGVWGKGHSKHGEMYIWQFAGNPITWWCAPFTSSPAEVWQACLACCSDTTIASTDGQRPAIRALLLSRRGLKHTQSKKCSTLENIQFFSSVWTFEREKRVSQFLG